MSSQIMSVPARELFVAKQAVHAAAAAPDSSSFALAGGRTLVRVQGAEEVTDVRVSCEPRALAYSPRSDELGLGCKGGRVLLVDESSGDVRATHRGDAGGYHELAWSPDGGFLAAGQHEPFVSIVAADTGKLLRVLDPDVFDDEGRTSVAFSPDRALLATTAYNSVLLWPADEVAARDGEPSPRKLSLRGHIHMVDLAFSADGSEIAAVSESEGQSGLHVWERESGKRLRNADLPRLAMRLAWAHDAGFFAVGELRGEGVTLWSAESLEPLDAKLEGASGQSVAAMELAPDGGSLVAGTDSGRVLLWSLEGVKA